LGEFRTVFAKNRTVLIENRTTFRAAGRILTPALSCAVDRFDTGFDIALEEEFVRDPDGTLSFDGRQVRGNKYLYNCTLSVSAPAFIRSLPYLTNLTFLKIRRSNSKTAVRWLSHVGEVIAYRRKSPIRWNPTMSASNNQLTSSGYSYDSAGNTTADAQGRTFVYDAENKQVSVSDGGGAVGQYWYDGDGKRVKKWDRDSGEVTIFVYDAAGKLIAEYTPSIASTEDAKVAYLTNDHLGSPRINTDANGAVTARHDYHPFGEEIATSQRVAGLGYTDDTVRKQFTGYERDIETDLDFAEARMYEPVFGRFTTTDPIQVTPERLGDPQQFNSYVYARNNPLAYVDPSGMDSEATDFVEFDKLSKKQKELLMGYFDTKDAAAAAKSWTKLTQENNSGAAAFLSVTNALSKTTLDLGGGKTMNALDMVAKITEIKRDRIEGALDKQAFDSWTGEGKGGFSIALANGKTEKGNVSFSGTDGFGSVHKGYDSQGYTSANSNFPRIQWNFREKDYGTDLDVDGFKPYKPFFPIPIRYLVCVKNSDAWQWFSKYSAIFGNPGFSVREAKKKK
jgi:RHS repeat-associated protein